MYVLLKSHPKLKIHSIISLSNRPGPISLFEFDPESDVWEQNELEPIEPWSVCPLMTSMNGLLYFLGDDSKHLQSFDPIKKIWKLLPKSKEVHLGGSLTVLDGKHLIYSFDTTHIYSKNESF